MDPVLSVSGIVIIAVMIILAIIMWKVAKLILIPIQILLFLALMFIVYKLVCSPENMDKISKGVKNGSIQEMVDKATDSAAKFVKKTVSDHVSGHSPSADKSADGSTDKSAAGSGQAAGSADSAAKTASPEKKEATQAVSEKAAPPAESVK